VALVVCGLVLWYLLTLRAVTLWGIDPGAAPVEVRARQRWLGEAHQQLTRYGALISALVASAPLLGLLGTVGGMITTFDALEGRGDPTAGVAGGVGAALLTTQLGLAVAIPGLLAHALLGARVRRLARALEALAVAGDARDGAGEGL
jgi:biopolymer transport protein ExbB/TolQ